MVYKNCLALLFLLSCDSRSVVSIPDATPQLKEFGESCTTDNECTTGVCYTNYRDTNLPGGICSNECEFQVNLCDPGYCVFEEDNIGQCWPSCEAGDLPCKEGWTCAFILGINICAPEELV